MIPMVSEAAIAICWVMFLTPLIVMNNHRAKSLRKKRMVGAGCAGGGEADQARDIRKSEAT
jgi:hypothetical protein